MTGQPLKAENGLDCCHSRTRYIHDGEYVGISDESHKIISQKEQQDEMT